MQKLILLILFWSAAFSAQAQYIDSSGTTPYIRQYVEENENNWNKSIIYVSEKKQCADEHFFCNYYRGGNCSFLF